MDEAASLVIRVLSEQVETATRRLRELEDQSVRTEQDVKKLGAVNFRNVAIQLAAFGLGIATVKREAEEAVKRWVEFDTAIKKVGSVADFTTKEFRELRKETLALSAALGVDAKESAEGLYEAFQADIPKGNAIEFLSTATKTAVGGITTVKSAVNSLTNVINAYGLDVGRAEEISDKLFTTVLYGKASFDQLGASLSGAAVPAAAMGVKFEEVLAMITQITSQGTSTSEAITQIERAIQSLINPTEAMVAVFRTMNVESGRQAIAQYGLVNTLEQVRKSYAGNDAALVKATGSVVALQAVLGTTGSKLKDTQDALDHVTNSAGATEKAFKANSDTVGSAINSIKSSVTALVEEMENSFGVIGKFAEALRGISGLMQQVASAGFTADTQNAMNLGGKMGVTTTLDQLDKLKAKQQELIKLGADASKATDEYRKANFGYLPELFTNAGARNAELAQTNKEIAALANNLNNVSDTDKAFGQITYEVNKLTAEQKKATDPVAVEGYTLRIQALRDEYAQLTGEIEGQAKAEADKAAAATEAAKAEDAKSAELLKKAEAQLKLEEEQRKQRLKTGAMANDLATSEVEKLRQKQELIRDAMTTKDADSRLDEMVGNKAIANLDEQIKLLEERNAKSGGSGGAGGAMAAQAINIADSLPELSDPFGPINAQDELAKQEEEIAKSYARRREAILAETRLTEDQRLALLKEAQDKYRGIMARADEQRMTNTLKLASDTFGQLSAIAGVFGKKGAAMAKGFAIMQATIDMISAAQAAYKATVGIPYVGPYLAPVAAAGALAVGAANVAKIKATEYSGAYEHGGMIPAGKYGLVGETGRPELVQGPAVVTSARTTEAMLGGRGSSNSRTKVVVHNYGNDRIEERRTQNGDEELVEFIVGQAANRVADDITKGGTRVSGAMEKKYNLGRGGA